MSSSPPPTPRPARRHGAVGGIVADALGRILLLEAEVLREGSWVVEVRLPKGSLRPGETDAPRALTEVRRLTSYRDLEVIADLGRERVEYHHRGVRYLRQEHFFLMKLHSLMKEAGAEEETSHEREVFAESFAAAAERLSFPSEQAAVLRAQAWWPG